MTFRELSPTSGLIPWALTFFSFLLGVKLLLEELNSYSQALSIGREKSSLQRVMNQFLELEETLESGLIPTQEKWDSLRSLPNPWGALVHESVLDLRSHGAPLLPTLKRLRSLVQHHSEALNDARAKSAQALGQAIACGLLVPVFGAVLFILLPGLSERPYFWLGTCLGALILSSFGGLWILSMAVEARWGGLTPPQRAWALSAQCAGERFLALVRSGHPPDLAWARSSEVLALDTPDLALAWGYSVFGALPSDLKYPQDSSASLLSQAGHSIRKSIHISLMEGRPCLERVETVLSALRQELKAKVDRELALLANRALKPLFLCIAPALLGLLTIGMWVTWRSMEG